jgi:hypothetical protein
MKGVEMKQIELEEKELAALMELLKEHLYYGWIEQDGEFELTSSGRVSPTLQGLYRRIRQEQQRR